MLSKAVLSLYESQDFYDVEEVEAVEDARYSADSMGVHQILKEMYEDDALLEAQAYAQFTNGFKKLAESAESRQELLEELSVLQESSGPTLIERIKKLFKDIWAKIQGVFAKFMSFLNAAFMDGKKFAKHYRKVLVGKDLSNFSGSAYKYNLENLSKDLMGKKYKSLTDMIEKTLTAGGMGDVEGLKRVTEAVNDIDKAIYKELANVNSSDTDDFRTGVANFFRSEEKIEFEKDSDLPHGITTMLDVLEKGDIVKSAESAKKAADSHYKAIISFYDALEKKARNGESKDATKAGDIKQLSHTDNDGPVNKRTIYGTGDMADGVIKLTNQAKKAHTKGETAMNIMLAKYIQTARSCVSEFKSILGSAVRHSPDTGK